MTDLPYTSPSPSFSPSHSRPLLLTQQHNTTQHSTAQHSTAQHSTTQHNTIQLQCSIHTITTSLSCQVSTPPVHQQGFQFGAVREDRVEPYLKRI
ncbi:hypothetical protein EYC84_005996 [Monilinia fructicola]|uniref:Uncharacterized protein n=1 Tax=Monilinia fructicola TaxID=38448 RepID=A0A5M9K0Z7_MONFR|nr:hypothetical protein EYC84_005996 [Monilinia fructicola]